ncbi:MAG: nucleotidyltransferase [Flavobacteriales bacterium]|nr:MAG: nucleotidyltransferase [Flavobacteriales bacterium]
MNNFSKNIIKNNFSIRQALVALNELGKKANLTLFVLNSDEQLIATLTDGDIRRALLAGKTLDDSIDDIMHKGFRSLKENGFELGTLRNFREAELELIPLLDDENRIIRIIDLNETQSLLPIDAVIMAGGEGKRLLPLTEKKPKPLLKIGEKPILDYAVNRLRRFGISNIHISVNYLKEKIIGHFGNGKGNFVNIQYVEETEPLGTMGAVSLINNFRNDYVLVMNSDLLTNIDFEDLFLTFIEKKADMAVASIPYKIRVPYATLEVNDNIVNSFKEKPTFTYYSNAGIYLMKKELVDFIPKNTRFDATDLMEKVIAEKLKLISYPILGYWLDIGRPEDYEKAQEDIKHLKL